MIEKVVKTEWRILKLEERHPFEIVAMEELLLQSAAVNNTNTIVFHLWHPSVSISRNQRLADVNIERCKADDVCVVKTLVGGRAVYHDPDYSLSFCAAMSLKDVPVSKKNPVSLFEFFLKRIIYGLSKMGINAELYDKNYIRVDGKKISGTAMGATQDAVVIHGSLLYDIPDVDVYSSKMLDYMNLNGHSRKQLHDDICSMLTCIKAHNYKLTRTEVCSNLAAGLAGSDGMYFGELSSDEKARLKELVKTKYSNPDWHPGVQERGLCWRPYGPVPLSATRGENPDT